MSTVVCNQRLGVHLIPQHLLTHCRDLPAAALGVCIFVFIIHVGAVARSRWVGGWLGWWGVSSFAYL